MTAQNDLDRTLGAWFGDEAAAAPPAEPLARVLETTRGRRPRPTLVAGFGSQWVSGSTSSVLGARVTLRPGLIIALVALLALALAGGALLIGSRLLAPKTPPHTYVNELVSAPDLSMPMAYPALVPLLDGRVLVIGDDGDGGGTGTRALVYDPATGISEPTGPLVSGESLWVESAVRLADGKVLVIGNTFASPEQDATQVFDPTTRRFAPVGPMNTPRSGAAVALLPGGHVLIAGGHPLGQEAATSLAELFDPDTSTFSTTGSLGTSHADARTAILPDGRVFVAPGASRLTAEVYDPGTGTFSAAGTMSSYFQGHIAIALPDGRVVLLGGSSLSGQGFADVWDPTSLTFSPGCRPRPCPALSPDGGLMAPESDLPGPVTGATLLDDGRILLLGRYTNWSGIYDPATGTTLMAQTPRAWGPSATRLADGRVLLAGGLTDGLTNHGEGGNSAPAVPTVEIFR